MLFFIVTPGMSFHVSDPPNGLAGLGCAALAFVDYAVRRILLWV